MPNRILACLASRIAAATCCVLLAGCADSPTSLQDAAPPRPSLDVSESELPWHDEVAAGYTDTWDFASSTGLVTIPPTDRDLYPGTPTQLTAVSFSGDTVPCTVTISGELNTCPPQIISGGPDGGGGGVIIPPNYPIYSPPACCGGGPSETTPQPGPRIVVSGDFGLPNAYGYRAPKKVRIAAPITIDVTATGIGLVTFTVTNSTWERVERLKSKDAGQYGVEAKYVLMMRDFTQENSSVPGARLVWVNNIVMQSRLTYSPEGGWGGSFAQNGKAHAVAWVTH